MGTPRTTSADDFADDSGRRHEVLGILTGTATILLALALASYDARGSENWIGPVGYGLAGVLVSALGVAAWLLPFELGLITVRLFRRGRSMLGVGAVASTFVIVLTGCALVHLALEEEQVFGGHLPGGVLGEVLGEVLRSLVGLAGAYVLCVSTILTTFVLRTSVSLTQIGRGFGSGATALYRRAADSTRDAVDAWKEAKRLEKEEREAAEALAEEEEEFDVEDVTLSPALEIGDDPAEDELEAESAAEEEEEEVVPTKLRKPRAKKKTIDGPKIFAPVTVARKSVKVPKPIVSTSKTPFILPPTTLLDEPPETAIRVDKATLRENAALLVEKLEAYKVYGRVDEIHPGPVVTMYEVEPKSGTKVSKIAGLADDLAMALAAQKVRIVAPIPGKARVGFELPNDVRQTVYLREILEHDSWRESKANLPMALGQDIAGKPIYGDLSKMPHLLVAGATGAGKSVGLNVMLASLLTKKTPEEVRLLMIDPKVVELAVFDGIPHMLLPVVTDMKKAALALRWAVDEMERRYQLFADAGARNIKTYNDRVEKVLDGEMSVEKLYRGKETPTVDPDAEHEPLPLPEPVKLPYVVVVVDEFADLMMVAAKDVEAAIARLAQKARAAGIHVILATQRPSVDVITGMIKANFPARMAFKVSQREDSKTILGRNGAEHLLGMGDMLMIPPGSSDLVRVHCAYISEDEVKAVCDHLRAQGSPVYQEEILKPREEGEEGAPSDDPVYDKAVACVADAGYCSISHIQRKLSVGYNKAAKLVDRMEADGVVGPPASKAGGRREVLIQQI